MNKLISRGLWTVLIAGGLSVVGATAANAAETVDIDATVLGAPLKVDVSLPINLGGLPLLGSTTAPLVKADVNVLSPTTPAQPSAQLVNADVNVLSSGTTSTPSASPINVDLNVLSSGSAPAALPAQLADVDVRILSSGSTTAPAAGQLLDADVQLLNGLGNSLLAGTQAQAVLTLPQTLGDATISLLGTGAAPESNGLLGLDADILPGVVNLPIIADLGLPLGLGDANVTIFGDVPDTGTGGGTDPGTPGGNPGTPGTPGGDPTDDPGISLAADGITPIGSLVLTGGDAGGLGLAGLALLLVGAALALLRRKFAAA